MKTVGQAIRGERCAVGMSRSELARRIGVHPETVKNWERDKTSPSIENVMRISAVLGINPIAFMNGGKHVREACKP